ncbi:adenylate/guanylate cyclase domain-containing protein [Acuticoccus kandeliae]|uniref:adenylate/guanylate cyclase domain-containing protein n=1 Tax=Acuticoccus kandeliae TaxID=2073160 RepID=UPI000D3ED630|nr:adenylate/guanylate cyclase domain-containing protein [Acuticoccus kandeliae]
MTEVVTSLSLSEPYFDRIRKTILFADVAESVRLMDEDEEGTVARWLALQRFVETEVAPTLGGRMVKRLGDGLMLEFDDAVAAVRAAHACLVEAERSNAGVPCDGRLMLRIGVHSGEVLSIDNDIFGRDVNVASRIMTLARPGELVVTGEIRNVIEDHIDFDYSDLGPCHLRHISEPVRVYRLSPPGTLPRLRPLLDEADLLPTIAVIPFRTGGPDVRGIGEMLAEEFIVALSQSNSLNVTSRLSTSAVKSWDATLARIGEALNANFVLSGCFSGEPDRLTLDLELAEVRTGRVLWGTRITESFSGLVNDQNTIDALVWEVQATIARAEVRRARSTAPPTLDSYALLTAATALMHRPSERDFALAERLLRTLMERASDLPVAMAAMARWHVLRVQQGWSDSPARDGQEALRLTEDALSIDPDNVRALVSEGFVLTNLIHQLDEALIRYDSALELCPNEPMGRLLRGTLHAFRGEGALAVRDTERALHLTPRDPQRYFYESLAASACIAAGDNARALSLAKQSLRANRGHTSTMRVKAVAELRLGDGAAARATMRELLRQQPGLTVSSWLKTAASAAYPVGQAFARSLAEAGLPN